MNASNTLNSVKSALRAAVKSKAFALVVLFMFFVALCFAFSLLAKACLALFGKTLGLIVYFVLSFGLIFAVEAITKHYTKRAALRAYR